MDAQEIRTQIKALKDQLRAYYPYRNYPEVDADMTEIQKEIAQLDRALDRIEAQTATKEVA